MPTDIYACVPSSPRRIADLRAVGVLADAGLQRASEAPLREARADDRTIGDAIGQKPPTVAWRDSASAAPPEHARLTATDVSATTIETAHASARRCQIALNGVPVFALKASPPLVTGSDAP